MSMKTCLTSSMLLRWVTRIGSKRKMLTQRRSISLCLLINGLLKRWVSTQIHQSKQSQTFPSTTYCKIHTTRACLTTSLRISPTETTSSLIAIAMKTTIIIRATWSTSCLTWHIWRRDSRSRLTWTSLQPKDRQQKASNLKTLLKDWTARALTFPCLPSKHWNVKVLSKSSNEWW